MITGARATDRKIADELQRTFDVQREAQVKRQQLERETAIANMRGANATWRRQASAARPHLRKCGDEPDRAIPWERGGAMRVATVSLTPWSGAASCGAGADASCKERLWSDEHSGELLHERFARCVECSALTDSCAHIFGHGEVES